MITWLRNFFSREPGVRYVTNLHDSGPGSLRAACGGWGARRVIFAVEGTIELLSPIVIVEPYLLVDGGCPSLPVTIKNYGFIDRAHNTVLRYLRFKDWE